MNSVEVNQVSVSSIGYLHPLNKSRHGKHREDYFAFYYQNNRQRINQRKRKQYSAKKNKKFAWRWRELFNTPKPCCPNCWKQKISPFWLNYCGEINCPVIVWLEKRKKEQLEKEGWFYDFQTKIALENLTPKKEKKIGGKNEAKNNHGVRRKMTLFSHTRGEQELSRVVEELFFYQRKGKTKRQLFEQRLDSKRMRLETKDKVARKKGWTEPDYREILNKAELLKKNQEWSIRGGQRLGNKYLSFLDLDIEKEKMPTSLQSQLGKNANCLLDYLNCFHVKTKKGYHVYLLTDYLLPNSLLYYTDKFGKRRIIGSIQSKGKYVVGFDSKNKKLIEKGSWFWHVKDLAGVKEKLGKFFIETGNKEQEKTDNCLTELQQKLRENQIKETVPLSGLNQNINHGKSEQQTAQIQAKILSKHKTLLPDLWKASYLDWKTKQIGYFLVNEYQREEALGDLRIGSTRNIYLIRGYKHVFLNKIL